MGTFNHEKETNKEGFLYQFVIKPLAFGKKLSVQCCTTDRGKILANSNVFRSADKKYKY